MERGEYVRSPDGLFAAKADGRVPMSEAQATGRSETRLFQYKKKYEQKIAENREHPEHKLDPRQSIRSAMYAAKIISENSTHEREEEDDDNPAYDAVSEGAELADRGARTLERATGGNKPAGKKEPVAVPEDGKTKGPKPEEVSSPASKYAAKIKDSPESHAKTTTFENSKAREEVNRRVQQSGIFKQNVYTASKQAEKTKAAQKAKDAATKTAHKIEEMLAKHKTLLLSVAGIGLLVLLMCFGLSSCASVFSNVSGAAVGGFSPTTDADMSDAEVSFTRKEMELQIWINNIPYLYPGNDEYNISQDSIYHDSIKLTAFLGARFPDYTLSDVSDELTSIYNALYTTDVQEITETRYRYERRTGSYTEYEYDEDGIAIGSHEVTYTYYEAVPYDYHILNATIRRNDFDSILSSRLSNDDEREAYDIYMATEGGHQTFANPFDSDWTVLISDSFGWRIHPITWAADLHNGVDIAMPEGTTVKSISKGTVTASAYDSSAGNYIKVVDSSGYEVTYMHLKERHLSARDTVEIGASIGKVGNTGSSTGAHLHLEIKDNAGNRVNPRFVVDH